MILKFLLGLSNYQEKVVKFISEVTYFEQKK